jgi:RNA polymerase sigma-70 factor (ECF subfamily)
LTNDADLLKLAAKGNEPAFLALYQRHQGPVFRFALNMSGQVETAEEIVQEIFLSLIKNGHAFSPEKGSLQGYLIGVARNMLRTRFRESQRFVNHAEPTTTGGELFDAFSKQQDLQDLRAAILNLPPNYREVIVLCDLEGLDYSQTASHLNCPVGTVRSRLHRARAILSARMQKRISAKGTAACRHAAEKLARPSGGTPDTVPVLRVL